MLEPEFHFLPRGYAALAKTLQSDVWGRPVQASWRVLGGVCQARVSELMLCAVKSCSDMPLVEGLLCALNYVLPHNQQGLMPAGARACTLRRVKAQRQSCARSVPLGNCAANGVR